MVLIRDPRSKIIQVFLPTLILGYFLFKCISIHSVKERMENLAIVLLAYIQIFGYVRKNIPPLNTITIAE